MWSLPNLSHLGRIFAGMRSLYIAGRRRYTGAVTKRLVDIDDELLREAGTILGARTMRETVNRALEGVVAAERRRRLIDRLESGDGIDLADESIMNDAWR